MPPSSRGFFRPREKSLIMLVLATFLFVCIGSIFFLPDRLSSGRRGQPGEDQGTLIGVRGAEGEDGDRAGGKVYNVYKGLRDAGREFIIPPPPLDRLDNPNVRHGVLEGPDPHRVDDRARLMAQVEMDSAVEELRRKQQQQVLQRPNLDPDKGRKSSSSSSSSPSSPVKKEPKLPSGPRKTPSGAVANKAEEREPLVQGGEDPDPEVRQRRNKVAEVSVAPPSSLSLSLLLLYSRLLQLQYIHRLGFKLTEIRSLVILALCVCVFYV